MEGQNNLKNRIYGERGNSFVCDGREIIRLLLSTLFSSTCSALGRMLVGRGAGPLEIFVRLLKT